MTKRSRNAHQEAVAADPNQWSEQSRHSVAFGFKREYVDKPYECWRCGTACTFTARDQKYTFEVKKASINQRRTFCAACWSESHRLRAALAERASRWAAEKSGLRSDNEFLCEWLDLLTRWKQFAPYKQDVAKMNMLRRLLKLK
jgi:hypothetical protein